MPTITPVTPSNVTSSDGIQDLPTPLLGKRASGDIIDLTGNDDDGNNPVEDINVENIPPRIPPWGSLGAKSSDETLFKSNKEAEARAANEDSEAVNDS